MVVESLSLVELVKDSHLLVRLDHVLSAAFDFGGQHLGVVPKSALLGSQNGLITLCFQQAVDAGGRSLSRAALNILQSKDFIRDGQLLFFELLDRVIGFRELPAQLVAIRLAKFAESCQTKAKLSHVSSLKRVIC